MGGHMQTKRSMGKRISGRYVQLLGKVWLSLPPSSRQLPMARAFARHLDRKVRLCSNRSQYFATFFLRNRPELELLRRVVDQWPRGSRLNMTILACSKGAEVYSMAWIIRSARPDIDLRIDAIDISPEIVDFAARGVYSMRKADERELTTEEVIRQTGDISAIPSSDKSHWLFERMSQAEIDSMFEIHGDEAKVRPFLREGITWQTGDAGDPHLAELLGPQDIVVANRFICHMMPPEAEKCLRNVGKFVKPGGYLFVSGLDLEVKTKIAMEGAWTPIRDLIREIHEGDNSLCDSWPVSYWGLEPLDEERPDWLLRYACVFQIGKRNTKDRELAGLAREA
jgi:chemotaxis methyl-accepting protein methylase